MLLEELFEKEIDRPIDGVIKAFDQSQLLTELEEYVVTRELAKNLDHLFASYLKYTHANGVWISGFFGSGKSHLLKMLAYLLENKTVAGKEVKSIFLDKPYFRDDATAAADLKKVVAIPTESILFNIDNKAENCTTKEDFDAVLGVFVRVFNEHCGYYGLSPFVARFERELDDDNLFERFKAAFKTESGKTWQQGRERINRMTRQVTLAYNTVTGQNETDIIDKYRQDYKMSIDDFANRISDYIAAKEKSGQKGFRLNFFVDEVGQYISDNTRLMTNLQTIAESLNVKCKGQSWIMVTAQEELAGIVGEQGRMQGNDFSKIQDRFKYRLKLSSTDVAEVVQKRLLAKKRQHRPQLIDLYELHKNNFNTMLGFEQADNYRNFKEQSQFIDSYPFIPYQFALFQMAIKTLSDNNAFEGKHSSVGERSMLGVCQTVIKQVRAQTVGQLATFDLMYEGIAKSLKGHMNHTIVRAEKSLNDPFALQLLKALLLIKYVKDFPTTQHNLSALMVSAFDQELSALKESVEQALNLLEQRTFVQRNGEQFEFLTNEEQDVEQAIKATEVEQEELNNLMRRQVFDVIIKEKKIRFTDARQDFEFTRKLDNQQSGREYDLAVHVISPFYPHHNKSQKHQTDSTYSDELLIVLPDDDRLTAELRLYLQTEKYVNLQTQSGQKSSLKKILSEKKEHNIAREQQISAAMNRLMAESDLWVKGERLDIKSDNAQTRVRAGFEVLIKKVFYNLAMLPACEIYNEKQVTAILTDTTSGTLLESDLPESEQEILNKISLGQASRITVKTLLEQFKHPPYGWERWTVLCLLARLQRRNKLDVLEATDSVTGNVLAKALTTTAQEDKLILRVQTQYSSGQVSQLKSFYAEFFDKTASTSDINLLDQAINAAFKEQLATLNLWLQQTRQYPFLRAVKTLRDEMAALHILARDGRISKLLKEDDHLLDEKEELLEPLTAFMQSAQKQDYDNACLFLQKHAANLDFVNEDLVTDVRHWLNKPDIYKNNQLKELQQTLSKLTTAVHDQIHQAREQATEAMDQQREKLKTLATFNQLTQDQRRQLMMAFDQAILPLKTMDLIARIRLMPEIFSDQQYPDLVERIENWLQPAVADTKTDAVNKPELNSTTSTQAEASISTPLKNKKPKIHASKVSVNFSEAYLENESQVEAYVDRYKQVLLAEIKKGKRIAT